MDEDEALAEDAKSVVVESGRVLVKQEVRSHALNHGP